MEPKHVTPRGPELPPLPSVAPESWPTSPQQFEKEPGVNAERQLKPAAPETELPVPVIPVTLGTTPVSPVATTDPVGDDSATPLVAGDDDVIEKEWVDKAKKIVTTTKGDPYRREYEIGKLQASYIEKRYGKKLGEAA